VKVGKTVVLIKSFYRIWPSINQTAKL